MRIVSLLPAATEICFALGLGNDVVGVSPECDYPPAARRLPALSRALLDYEGKSSAETSRMVGERLASGRALYEIDEEGLRTARPDLILTQGLCEVCAPAADNVRSMAAQIPTKPEVVSLDPHSLNDILGDIRRVGDACHVEDAADSVVVGLQARMDAVGERAAKVRERPKALCLEWLEPPFVAGHWVPEMVDLAGGMDVLGRAGQQSVQVDPKTIALSAADVAVLMPCGFHIDRARKEAARVATIPGWRDLPAVRRDHVWLVDASSYFNRPGPRVVDGLEILAHILHPETFPKTWTSRDLQRWTG